MALLNQLVKMRPLEFQKGEVKKVIFSMYVVVALLNDIHIFSELMSMEWKKEEQFSLEKGDVTEFSLKLKIWVPTMHNSVYTFRKF